MIGKLSGIIDSIYDTYLILNVGGVGYVVHASRKTLLSCGQAGDAASFLIETQVREDAITLFGFLTAAEQAWFKLLTSVQGVGAKVGLAILAVCPAERLGSVIAAQDRAALTEAEGVGPKLATRILSELKDKSGKIDMAFKPSNGAGLASSPLKEAERTHTGKGEDEAAKDALSALINLGYGRVEAYEAVMKARNDNLDAGLQDLITKALKTLSA